MKMYIAGVKDMFSEGACLVFANDIFEARRLAWPTIKDWFECDYIQMRVNLLKDSPYLKKEKLSNEPHVVESPRACCDCELWGVSELDKNGRCEECAQYAEDWNDDTV